MLKLVTLGGVGDGCDSTGNNKSSSVFKLNG